MLIVAQLVKKFLVFYGIVSLITVFTSAICQWRYEVWSHINRIWREIWKFFVLYRVHLSNLVILFIPSMSGSHKWSIPFKLSDWNLFAIFYLSHASYIPYLILYLTTLLKCGEQCNLCRSSLYSFLLPLVTSFSLGSCVPFIVLSDPHFMLFP
jgi:hypothetical protein